MKNYLTIPQAAKLCSVNRSTLLRWVNSNKIKAYSTPGGHKRILKTDLNKWFQENQLPFRTDGLDHSNTRILIVDDDIAIQKYLKKMLSGLFTDIETASDGFEAGKKVIQFKPDLMLLDLVMPGMDGFEVCKNIKEDPETKGTKILIMTGQGSALNREKAVALGADGFFEKPVTKEKILNYIERLLK